MKASRQVVHVDTMCMPFDDMHVAMTVSEVIRVLQMPTNAVMSLWGQVHIAPLGFTCVAV
jgi:hypothetical protein